MREIKFRAWDKKENEMFYSSMYQDKTSMAYGLSNFLSECSDIEDTLMQYTGLKDKNGVEIYEGDIVVVTEEDEDSCMGREFSYKGAVSYGNSLKLNKYAPQYPSSFCLISKSFYKEQALLFNDRWNYEVIGNIYENKNLLQGK